MNIQYLLKPVWVQKILLVKMLQVSKEERVSVAHKPFEQTQKGHP